MTCWTEYDPLREIIVGDCNAPGDFDWFLNDGVKSKFNLILEETKEDLQNLSDYLTKLGIRVHRPKPTVYKGSVDIGNFLIPNPASPIVPRDQYLSYNNLILQTYTSMVDRYLDSSAYYHIFKEQFDKGANWISMPPPILEDLAETDKWWIKGEEIYHHKFKDQLLWHTATMFKLGDALITNTLGPGNFNGLEWMSRNLPDTRIIENKNTHQKGYGHIDHGWFMTDDETVFCVDSSWVPEVLKTKEIIELHDLFDPFDDVKFFEDYSSTNGKYSVEWLDKWLNGWKGYAQECFFDTNVLIIDSNNILFTNTQPKIFKLMESKGINCHVVPQRHSFFWEGGVHCLTLDLVRFGNRRSII
jgi:hypothetical protein